METWPLPFRFKPIRDINRYYYGTKNKIRKDGFYGIAWIGDDRSWSLLSCWR